jgi:hypothetical protein
VGRGGGEHGKRRVGAGDDLKVDRLERDSAPVRKLEAEY